jgi:acetyl esterase
MIDPQAKAVHDVMTSGPSLDQRGVDGARAWSEEMAAPPGGPDPRLDIEDRDARGVGVRVYRPVETSRLPVILFIHGGGWVLGNLESADFACRELAAASGVVVVSVDYRLSPEVQYPGPLEDCVTALRWVVEDGDELGFDGDAICVAGESSGGHLAASTVLSARDQGLPVALQLLVNPVIDPGMDTASWREFGDDMLPVSRQMSWMWDLYAGSPAVRSEEPLVNLTLERDLGGLPETVIITSEYDPLRDEAEEYGRRLQGAGVTTRIDRLPGQVHAVFGFSRAVDACAATLRSAGEEVGNRLLHQPIGGKSS